MNIKNITQTGSKFNINTVKEIFEHLEDKVKKNVGALHLAVSSDNEEHAETEEFTKLIETIERVNSEDWIMQSRSKDIIYEGMGAISVVADSKPDTSLYLILKALKTHNNIVLFVQDKIHETTKKLIEYVNDICKELKYKTYVDYFEYNNFKQLDEYVEAFKTFIFINKPNDYFEFTEKVKDKNIIYSSYGTMSLYLDDKNLKDELLKMDEYVFNNNIELDLIKDTSVEAVVDKINSNLDNYCAVIFTKDKEKAYYFIENVRAKQIFVNKNPYKGYLFCIEDRVFVYEKKIYI